MKYLFYIIILCLICNVSYAQNSAKARKFIKEIITDKNVNYQDSVDKSARASMHELLKSTSAVYNYREDSVEYEDSIGVKKRIARQDGLTFGIKRSALKGRVTGIAVDSLILTDAEIAYANSEIDKMSGYKWTGNLLPNSKLLLKDSLSALQKRWDNLRNKSVAGLSKQEREKWHRALYARSMKEQIYFHKLSSPIFLRNDTYCLFYYEDSCIYTIDWGCGSGSLIAYKKVKGKWVKWGYFGTWMS